MIIDIHPVEKTGICIARNPVIEYDMKTWWSDEKCDWITEHFKYFVSTTMPFPFKIRWDALGQEKLVDVTMKGEWIIMPFAVFDEAFLILSEDERRVFK